jgi:3-hydroxypropanoate dehydrogenase
MTGAQRSPIDEASLSAIFTQARTHYKWRPWPISVATLAKLYDIAKLGPTSANCCPMRIVYVCSAAAKDRLLPALSKGNVAKAASASVIVIVAQDRNYLDRVPRLFPVGYDARSWFTATKDSAEDHGLRNTMLQAAYFIIAARALGLDCGPMSGFNSAAVDSEFLGELDWESRLLINLGYGADTTLEERKPRLPVDEACRIL